MERLQGARVSAAAAHAAAVSEEQSLESRAHYLNDVISRFVRRRDHLLAAGEANPSESRQAAELATTAERLRQGVDVIRRRLIPFEENAANQTRTTAEALARIDAAMTKLTDAVKSLELVKLEQATKDRITAMERSSYDRLARLGSMPAALTVGQAPATNSNSQPVDIEFHVREVTRLAYEAEALADLQRERLS